MSRPVLIVALGNRLRGDDAAGLLALAALRGSCSPVFELAEGEAALLDLTERERPAALAVVDAARPAGPFPPCGWLRLRWPEDAGRLARERLRNTHTLELPTLLGLLATLERLPPITSIYAIAGSRFDLGATPSPAVCAAAQEVAEALRNDLRPWSCGTLSC